MKPRFLLSFLGILFVYFSANAQLIHYSSDIPKEKVRIVPEQMYGGNVSESISDLSYIELETAGQRVLGTPTNLIFIDDRIALLDDNEGVFYLYNQQGKLIKVIEKIDGIKINDQMLFYELIKEGNHFVGLASDYKVKIDREGNIFEKDLNYKYKNQQKSIKLKDVTFEYDGPGRSTDTVPRYALTRNGKPLVNYNLKHKINQSYYEGKTLVKINDTSGFVVFPIPYTIMALNEKGISKVYEFIFPAINSIDTSEYGMFENNVKLYDFVDHYPHKIHAFGRILNDSKYLYFYMANSYFQKWVAFDEKNNKFISLVDIVPDKSNDFLNFLNREDLFTDGSLLYTFIYPDEIAVAKIKSKEEKHVMRKKYADLEKSKNPILVRFKLK
ncbi:6-bladed beta-propeller [Sphingobacterium kyonggiense]